MENLLDKMGRNETVQKNRIKESRSISKNTQYSVIVLDLITLDESIIWMIEIHSILSN